MFEVGAKSELGTRGAGGLCPPTHTETVFSLTYTGLYLCLSKYLKLQ